MARVRKGEFVVKNAVLILVIGLFILPSVGISKSKKSKGKATNVKVLYNVKMITMCINIARKENKKFESGKGYILKNTKTYFQ